MCGMLWKYSSEGSMCEVWNIYGYMTIVNDNNFICDMCL